MECRICGTRFEGEVCPFCGTKVEVPVSNVAYIIEKPKNPQALKRKYIEALAKQEKDSDTDFYRYATDPENIVINEKIICDVVVKADVQITMDYKKLGFETRTKGYEVEARSDKLYVSPERETLSSWDKYSRDFRFQTEKYYHYVKYSDYGEGYITEVRDMKIDPERFARLDENADKALIDDCMRSAGLQGLSKLRSDIAEKLTSVSTYAGGDEEKRMKEAIGTNKELYKAFSIREVRLVNSPFDAKNGVFIVFRREYEVGVEYEGVKYMNRYKGEFGDIEVKYCERAAREKEQMERRIRRELAMENILGILSFVLVLGISIAIFIVNARLSGQIETSEKFVEDWMSALVDYPNTFVALVPWIAMCVTFLGYKIDFFETLRYYIIALVVTIIYTAVQGGLMLYILM